MDPCRGEYLWYKGNSNFQRRKKMRKDYRQNKMGGGMMRPMYEAGGKTLKPVNKKKNPGLAKLPTKVRNKMGFKKNGGSIK